MENHKAILSAVRRILMSLMRILLRNGIPFSAFADIAKKAYVNVAMEDFKIHGRKQSISRISILTGLHRKEVKAIQQAVIAGDDSSPDDKGNRAARVISG